MKFLKLVLFILAVGVFIYAQEVHLGNVHVGNQAFGVTGTAPPPPITDSISAAWWNFDGSKDGYPIGGGAGFADSNYTITSGNGSSHFYVADSAHFYAVMNDSFATGDTIYIADNADINIGTTEWANTDDNLMICSGRGRTLGDTISWGGILRFAEGDGEVLKFYSDGFKMSGVRMIGSTPHYHDANSDEQGRPQALVLYNSDNAVIENCEFIACGYNGILVGDGCEPCSIRNCYFRNIRRRGSGYPINTDGDVDVYITACYFDGYRHAVASGVSDSNYYEISYCYFDDHAVEYQTIDKHDAGIGAKIFNNTIMPNQTQGNPVRALNVLTGAPDPGSLLVYNNWTRWPDSASAWKTASQTRLRISDNHYGTTQPDGISAYVPTADGQISTDSGAVPLTVTFEDEASSDPDGSIAWYEWDFGIGDTEDRVRHDSTQYIYTQYGIYHPKFYVFDNSGLPDYDTFTVLAVPTGDDVNSFFLSFWFVDSYHDDDLGDSLMAQVIVEDDTVWEQSFNGDSTWKHYVEDITTQVGEKDSITIELRLVYKTNANASWYDFNCLWDDIWMWNGEVLNGGFEEPGNANIQPPDYWTADHVSAGGGYFGWSQNQGQVVSGRMSGVMRTTTSSQGKANDYCYFRQRVNVIGQ